MHLRPGKAMASLAAIVGAASFIHYSKDMQSEALIRKQLVGAANCRAVY